MLCRSHFFDFSGKMPKSRCKACSKPSVRLKEMTGFERKLNMSIKACFSMLTAIEVKENEKICRKCLRTLVKCSDFIEMCEVSEAVAVKRQECDETEIEEEIEVEDVVEQGHRTVTFEEPPHEEPYESDFEQLTSEDEGIHEDFIDAAGKSVLKFYCTVCRKSEACNYIRENCFFLSINFRSKI